MEKLIAKRYIKALKESFEKKVKKTKIEKNQKKIQIQISIKFIFQWVVSPPKLPASS